MKPTPHSDSDREDQLERLLHRTMRDLPLRRAPPTLERRVTAELQRHAALPWWLRSFANWPPLPRIAFVIGCCSLVVLALFGSSWMSSNLSVYSPPNIRPLVSLAGGLAVLLARVVPPAWLYAGLMMLAVLYATLFGLGAAAYRTLYLKS